MTNEARKLSHFVQEERWRRTHDHADAANESQSLTPQEILRKLRAQNSDDRVASADPQQVRADSRTKPHPKKTVVTSLKRFINLREDKIKRQVSEGDHLLRAEQARALAQRLSDPKQVTLYIDELNQQAVNCTDRYQTLVDESKQFWYGQDGLEWLAAKKGMKPTDWLAYADVMDEPALRALAGLIERDLLQRFIKSTQ